MPVQPTSGSSNRPSNAAAIHYLERVAPDPPGRPEGFGADHPMRAVTRRAALEPGGWTVEVASAVATQFDELAAEWHSRWSEHRLTPLIDAFDRGGPIPSGIGIEVGSGTGLVTPWLSDRFTTLVAVDLSMEMLLRAPAGAGHRVRADAARLPLPSGVAGAVIAFNAFLFPQEVDRVLEPDGALVWLNSNRERTPIYLPPDDVAAAMGPGWQAVAAEAGWGSWMVLRRS